MSALRMFIIVMFSAFHFGCNSADISAPVTKTPENLKIEQPANIKTVEKVTDEIPNDFFVTRQIYKIDVKADGTVLFEGIRNTKFKGKTKGRIDNEKIKELIGEFEKADYFNLNDEYNFQTCPNSFTDAHDVNTSIQLNGRRKSVYHYLGCWEFDDDAEKPLSKLTLLEDKIREISGAKRWIGERK
jgi:hypothetical protein